MGAALLPLAVILVCNLLWLWSLHWLLQDIDRQMEEAWKEVDDELVELREQRRGLEEEF